MVGSESEVLREDSIVVAVAEAVCEQGAGRAGDADAAAAGLAGGADLGARAGAEE